MTNLQPGQMLGPYRITNQVGKGGMATVYKAYQAAMDRYVAVKVLPSQLADSAEFTGRFHQEARIIANLEHPHILPVFDYGESDGVSYLVMRYLEAGTLKDKVDQGTLPLAEVDRLFTQLASALAYAHENGVIHRDLKPSNVLVDAQGNVFLTDFGIARLLEGNSKFTQTDAIMGTPAYISPEQAQGQRADQRADIYALGIILYEMLTGQVPFTADTPLAVIFKHVSEPLPLPSSLKTDIAPVMERVLLKALAKNPHDRFQNVAEFVAAWKEALPGANNTTRRAYTEPEQTRQITTAPPATSPADLPDMQPKEKSSRGCYTAVAIGCLASLCLLLAVGGGLVQLRNWGRPIVTNLGATAAALPTTSASEDTAVTAPSATTETISGGNEPVPTPSGEQFTIAIGDEIAKDSPASGAGFIENPGDKDNYTFTAVAGQTVYLQVLQVPTASDLVRWRLVDETGSELFNTCLQCSDPGVKTLERGGVYTLIVGDERDLGSGSYAFKLWDVPAADTFTTEIGEDVANGSPGEGAGFIETPGAKDEYSFTAVAGQFVYFQVVQPPQSSDLLRWRVVDEIGSEILNTCLQCSDPGVKVLDRGGTYTIIVGNESGPATGTYAFKTWDVPPPDQFTIQIGDTVSRDIPGPGAGNIESPGVKDEYTFTATAGQEVYFQVVQPPQSSDLLTWRVLDDTGSEIFSTCLQCSDPGIKTLDRGGTYTIMVGNNSGAAIGAYQIRISAP
ncbi:MAG TPA: serine/threonine-protein kinase [Chloroflexota bacterium]|nr:serine/threonine-protein kinase [Chloroflexota bacterium]